MSKDSLTDCIPTFTNSWRENTRVYIKLIRLQSFPLYFILQVVVCCKNSIKNTSLYEFNTHGTLICERNTLEKSIDTRRKHILI